MSVSHRIVKGNELPEFFITHIRKALEHQQATMSKDVEYYIVNLLLEFSNTDKYFDTHNGQHYSPPLAMLLAKALHSRDRLANLKRLGDIALYTAGFFSENIMLAQLIDLDYYIAMGGSAYHTLAVAMQDRRFSSLFSELSDNFAILVAALAEVSDKTKVSTNTDILHLYERWLRTGDCRAKKLLLRLGITLPQNGHRN